MGQHKQDVSRRLLLEILRVEYNQDIISRGPELVASHANGTHAIMRFSNESLVIQPGIYVGDDLACERRENDPPHTVSSNDARHVFLNFSIEGPNLIVECPKDVEEVHVNSDVADCFLYGEKSMLPAPPVIASCKM